MAIVSKSKGADVEPEGFRDFLRAAKDGDLDKVKSFCATHTIGDINYVPPGPKKGVSCNALLAACSRGNFEIVEYLTSLKGIDPTVQDEYGNTPLHYACKGGNNEDDKIIGLLLKTNGVNVGALNFDDKTPVQVAEGYGSLLKKETMAALVERSPVPTSQQLRH